MHGFCLLDLFSDRGLISRSPDCTDNAKCHRQVGTIHHGQHLMQEETLTMCIMHQHVVDSVTILADGHRLEAETILNETTVHLLAEDHLLAMHEVDCAVRTIHTVSYIVVDAVVENHAVLQNLNHSATLVLSRGHHHLLADVKRHIQAAGKERAACAKGQLGRNERVLGRSIGR